MGRNILLVVLFKMVLMQSFSQVPDGCAGGVLPYKFHIAGFRDSVQLTSDQLLKGGRLAVDVNGYEVTSFTVGASVTRGGVTWCGEATNNGAAFTDQIRTMLQRFERGQLFFIDHVVVKDREGKTFCLEGIKFTVR